MISFVEHTPKSVSRLWLSPYVRISKENDGFCFYQMIFGRSVMVNWPSEKFEDFMTLLSAGAEETDLLRVLQEITGVSGECLMEQLMRDGILE